MDSTWEFIMPFSLLLHSLHAFSNKNVLYFYNRKLKTDKHQQQK